MKHIDTQKSRFNANLVTCLIAFFVLTLSSQIQAQSQNEVVTFKVEAPTEAKSLTKDSVSTFVSFSPIFVEGKTYVRWMVENDRKDGVFIIERSDDGNDFEALGFKDRVGTEKNVKLFYSFIDEEPPVGSAHYRVMQVGTDQTFSYSPVVKIKTGAVPSSGGSALDSGK